MRSEENALAGRIGDGRSQSISGASAASVVGGDQLLLDAIARMLVISAIVALKTGRSVGSLRHHAIVRHISTTRSRTVVAIEETAEIMIATRLGIIALYRRGHHSR